MTWTNGRWAYVSDDDYEKCGSCTVMVRRGSEHPDDLCKSFAAVIAQRLARCEEDALLSAFDATEPIFIGTLEDYEKGKKK